MPRPPYAPEVKGHPLFGLAWPMRRDPLGVLNRCFATTRADAVFLRLGPYRGTLFRHPDHIRHILVDHAGRYTKQTRGFHKSRLVLGQGLVTSEGELWQRQRRIATPALARPRIAGFAKVFSDAADHTLADWRTRNLDRVDLFAEMMRLTLDVALRTLLGAPPDADLPTLSAAVTEILERTNDIITNPLYPPMWVPLPRTLRFKKALAIIDAFVYRTIAQRRAQLERGEPPADLLGMLLDAARAESAGISDRQLRDEAVTALIAGHETTANALAWTVHLLAHHPDVERRLRDEVTTVLAGRSPAFDDLPRLRYTRAVLDESMRLYPPAWMISRMATEDDDVAGLRIDRGQFALISPYVLHRNPNLWPSPDAFDPTRFLDDRAAQIPKYAYLPFGAGPRFCIGANFALAEATMVLAILLQHAKFTPLPHPPVEPYAMITLRPKHGVPMRLDWLA